MLFVYVFILSHYPENLRSSASHYVSCGAVNYGEFTAGRHAMSYSGALNHVGFRAAMHPTWCMAEREGFEPSVPLLAEHTISSRAPSANSVISPRIFHFIRTQIFADPRR
jgi:hypothetical protein